MSSNSLKNNVKSEDQVRDLSRGIGATADVVALTVASIAGMFLMLFVASYIAVVAIYVSSTDKTEGQVAAEWSKSLLLSGSLERLVGGMTGLKFGVVEVHDVDEKYRGQLYKKNIYGEVVACGSGEVFTCAVSGRVIADFEPTKLIVADVKENITRNLPIASFFLALALMFLLSKPLKNLGKEGRTGKFLRGAKLMEIEEVNDILLRKNEKKEVLFAKLKFNFKEADTIKKLYSMTPLAGDFSLGEPKLIFPEGFEFLHLSVSGSTGMGKSTLIKHYLKSRMGKGRVVTYDSKAEMLQLFYNKDRGDIIFNPFDKRSVVLTPFSDMLAIYKHERRVDMSSIEIFVSSLVPSPPSKSGAGGASDFFTDAARDIIRELGLIAGARVLKNEMSEKEGVQFMRDACLRSDPKTLASLLEGTDSANRINKEGGETTQSILGTLNQKGQELGVICDLIEDGREIFSPYEFLREEKPRCLFLTSKASRQEKADNSFGTMLDSLVLRLLDMTEAEVQLPTYFVIDELDALRKLDKLERGMAEGRSRKLSVLLGYQVFSQLVKRYGQESAESLISNANTHVIFGVKNKKTAEFLSGLAGKMESLTNSETMNLGLSEASGGDFRASSKIEEKCIVTTSEIQTLSRLACVVLLPGSLPVVHFSVPYFYKDPDQPNVQANILWSKAEHKVHKHLSEKREKEQLKQLEKFDSKEEIIDIVDAAKHSKNASLHDQTVFVDEDCSFEDSVNAAVAVPIMAEEVDENEEADYSLEDEEVSFNVESEDSKDIDFCLDDSEEEREDYSLDGPEVGFKAQHEEQENDPKELDDDKVGDSKEEEEVSFEAQNDDKKDEAEDSYKDIFS